jgi:virginiamycin A acetyltransferase
LRKRFNDELIGLLLQFKWWEKSVEEINSLIPILTCSDLEKVREEIEARL